MPLLSAFRSSFSTAFKRVPTKLFLGFLAIYKNLGSPLLHLFFGPSYGCRFVPTCSHYAQEAVHLHGPKKGGILTLKRISRCHPFTKAGYDPVPML